VQLTHRFACSFVLASVLTMAGITGALAEPAAERGPNSAQASVLDSAAPAASREFSVDDQMGSGSRIAPPDALGRYRFIVRFVEPSVARYEGGFAGLAPTSPRVTGATRLDVNSPAARAYRDFLSARHDEYLSTISRNVGRSVDTRFQFKYALNGVSIALTREEARIVEGLPFVAAIEINREDELLTDEGPVLIGAPSVWAGETLSGLENRGEGIIIGIIDSGFNHGHPSFTEVASDGYVHINPYGDGVFTGLCADPDAPDFEDVCNNKVIGTYNLHPDSVSSDDTAASGHGTHVASTAGGNPLSINFPFQYLTHSVDISGVAPRANLINFKVCEPLCPADSRVAAVDFAIADGVHVLNHSIGNAEPPWASAVSLAFLDANAAGIVTAASAGNSGPGPSTAASTGPWNLAVGASTHQRRFALFANLDNDPTQYPGSAFGAPLAGPYSGTLRYAGDVDPDNFLGCDAFPEDAFENEAALMRRGGCTFAQKVGNAVAAGAEFVVIANSEPGILSLGGLEAATVSVLSVSQASGNTMIAVLDGGTAPLDVQAIIDIDPDNADIMAGFSSRGPASHATLTPAITAPGVQILAGSLDANGQFVAIGGTSMSSPHVAGAAALLMAERPDWTPTEVRSALTLAANPNHRKEDGITPADPFDMGSGRLDVAAAANLGFVMDETIENFVLANPATGGDPGQLNLSSIKNFRCPGSCSYERTIRSVVDVPIDYEVSSSAPAGMSISVTPSSFTLNPGASLTLDVDVDVSGAVLDEWLFAEIKIEQAGVARGNGDEPLLAEDFSSATFPPSGWTSVNNSAGGTATWQRWTTNFISPPASARRVFGGGADGFQDDWLISPSFDIPDSGAVLSFRDGGQWMNDYGYSGVLISAASCDPADGDFVEVAELDDTPGPTVTVTWRAESVEVFLNEWAGATACIAFRYSGTFAHTLFIDDVLVTPLGETPILSPARMPVAIIADEPKPRLVVSPGSLTATQQRNEVTAQSFEISNPGELELQWGLFEQGPLGGGEPFVGPGVLWNNPQAGTSGRVNNFSVAADTGWYQSDAFALLNTSRIERIETRFFLLGSPAVTALNWAVYADAGGVPAGHPEQDPDSALWSFSAPLGAPGTLFQANNMRLDLAEAGAPMLELPAGTYWLVAYPTIQSFSLGPNVLAAWFHGASGTGRQIAPGGLTPGIANWGPVPEGRAFTLTGSTQCADNFNPWTNPSPTSGSVPPGGSQSVNVEFYSTGLIEGSYDSALCITSNDPDLGFLLMPVRLNVVNLPSASISANLTELEVETGETGTSTLTLTNSGLAALDWSVFGASGRALTRGSAMLYDQTATQTGFGRLAIYDLDGPETWAVQLADDFVVPFGEAWVLDRVVANGFFQVVGPDFVPPTRVFIYSDDDGSPGSAVASFSNVTPTRVGGTLDIQLPATVTLQGGSRYWVSVQPEMDWNLARWFWFLLEDEVGEEHHYRNPGNGYQTGCIDWTPVSGCFSTDLVDLSFQLFGAVEAACDAIDSISWLSANPEFGTVAAEGGQQDIELIADGTGVLPGSYTAVVCIETNDPANDLLPVQVNLTVTGVPPDEIFSDRFEQIPSE
jgi:subtilisin family serine protease